MRESRDRYRRRRPTVSQDRDASPTRGEWRTLREASDITGIPIGTLRKWCRRESVESYLESDGDLTLRMVEMGSVRSRAESSGRESSPLPRRGEGATKQSAGAEGASVDGRTDEAASYELRAAGVEEEAPGPQPPPEPATMIVPVDAWNKMLNQLGNLHEAGQQLAEARERAAKAETEATFLRERLAEMREVAGRRPPAASREEEAASKDEVAGRQSPVTGPSAVEVDNADAGSFAQRETTSFWRYVARGWKGRRR